MCAKNKYHVMQIEIIVYHKQNWMLINITNVLKNILRTNTNNIFVSNSLILFKKQKIEDNLYQIFQLQF